MSHVCPTDDELRAFLVGDLSGIKWELVADHVADCSRCDETLAQWDGYTDDFLSDLRSLDRSNTSDLLPISAEVLAGVHKAVGSDCVASDIAFDPGRRYARKLADGPCRLGRFELQAELGDGSFGYVFRAHDLELDRTVAVKIQRAGSLANDDEVRRFLNEARSAAQLQHPGIVSLYDSGQTEDGVCFLVAEYIEGRTLESRLQSGRFDSRRAAEIVASLAETLQYAHERGVVHRDIKPSNIILDSNERPHITDFGLAKRLVGERTETTDGRIMGTPAYMSPEQALGNSNRVDVRSDVYSLGVILYELLTGERPFHGNRRLLLLQVLEDEPRSLRQLDDGVPRDLETVCLKAMSKNPTRRYQTARELADDLQRFLRGESILAKRAGYAVRLWRWCRRRPVAAAVLLAVSLGPMIGFWYLLYLSTYFVEETALDSARMEADMLVHVHEFYSKEIVDRVDPKKVRVGPEYKKRRDTIPLPATFLLDGGEYISRHSSGMSVRVYSGHPWRSDGGPKDEFQHRTLIELQRKIDAGDDDISAHTFTEQDASPTVRYARGLIIKANCVKCHNTHKESPKKDWKEGDLVGVLEVTRSLDRDIERTQSGLRGAFVLMGSIALLLVGVSLTMVAAARVQTRRKT